MGLGFGSGGPVYSWTPDVVLDYLNQRTTAGVAPIAATPYLPITSDIISGNPVSVLAAIPRVQHEAIADHTSAYDCTTEIQGLLSDMPASGGIDYGRGRYRHGNIQIANKTGFSVRGTGARIDLTGSGLDNLGIQLSGDCTSVEVSGLTIVGDGVKGNNHRGVYSLSGANLADIRVENLRISSVPVGISMNANISGSIDGFSISDIYCQNIVGIASGEGYGVHVAFANSGSARGTISNIRGKNVGRHLLYIARASDVDFWGIQSIGHRSSLTADEIADATDGRGRVRPAVLIARSRHIRGSGIRAVGGYDGAVVIATDPEGTGQVSTYDIRLSDLALRSPADSVPLFLMGDSNPSVSGFPEDVTVEGMRLWADYGGTGGIDLLRHNCGKRIVYRGIDVALIGTSGTRQGVELRASGESAGSTLYNEDVTFDGLTLRVEGSGTCRGLFAATSAVNDTAARISIRNAEGHGALVNAAVTPGAAVTNTNFRLQPARVNSGAGSPEGVLTAPVGALYLRTDGGAGAAIYVKETGTGNTGWVAK